MEVLEKNGSRNGGTLASGAKAPVMRSRLVGVDDAATFLGVSSWSVRRLVDNGHLRRVRLPLGKSDCRRLLFDRIDLECLVDVSKD
jgi:hypothetical protein